MAKKSGDKKGRARVYKKIDLVGISRDSFEDAIRSAVERAGETVRDLRWFEVKEFRGAITDNQVAEYQVVLSVSFEVH